MTNAYDEECLQAFLDNQLQLFPEPVADSIEEAEFFLEDCLAVVCEDQKELLEYMEDNMDIAGLSEEEVLESPEVFALSKGRYLLVEG
ncbi:MAG: glyoxalase [Lachnospiraceae bacterium]|nr:glyoxalase [Lachnospiraceae bacterium]